ncbi:MAG: hypothetical protein HY695_05155 [Deltaproteobacteria bacterium]|nr:hypothetical protein [Deltaproteobacteria bacterium]
MGAKNMIQDQLARVLKELPETRQAEVLDFALFLRERELVQIWDAISDKEAAVLQAEFAADDIAFAEAAMADYLSLLQHEDEA